MTTPSPFLNEVSSLVSSLEAALVAQSPDTVQSLCLQLQQTLQAKTRTPPPENWTTPENQVLAQTLDARLAAIRKTLLQQGAAAERALTTLFPERAVGAYGEKSGFGTANPGGRRQSYLA